jgi:adenine-specific DNA-methyltransferase
MHDAEIQPLAQLPAPRFDLRGITLFEGDCLDLLPLLPRNSFDLVITSPPYNIGKEYERERSVKAYLSWCERWLKEIARVTKPTGSFWLNLGYLPLPDQGKAVPIAYLLWDRIPMYLVQEIMWHYGAGVAASRSFSPRNEKFLWYVKSPTDYVFNLDAVRDPNVKYPHQKKNGKLKCNPLGKNPSDVWHFPKVTSGQDRSSTERTPHPAQFPIRVIDRIVKACSNPGAQILDPFMGSGTVAEAALRNGRKGMGIEIRPDYVDIAIARVGRAIDDESQQLFPRAHAAENSDMSLVP